ncbi:hypothetical protein DH2020_019665 [Rehmannia glutinosa]|uniref:DNA topoisomerase n=1 Tax=Rehmannia glutinosa TaxID=99300 RepID=A0ABR0WG44_REHGL
MAPKVLMVAEKPSIALAIATVLSGGGDVFLNTFCYDNAELMNLKQDSNSSLETCLPLLLNWCSESGKCNSVDFPARYQDWNATNPLDLFDAPIVKTESTPKYALGKAILGPSGTKCHGNFMNIFQTTKALVLQNDVLSDSNIHLVSVIECTGFQSKDGKKVYRARFSSVTEKDILKAMNCLVEPNKNEALAVDARQEIDLKVGVAFTRFQTSYFNGKYGNLDSRVISHWYQKKGVQQTDPSISKSSKLELEIGLISLEVANQHSEENLSDRWEGGGWESIFRSLLELRQNLVGKGVEKHMKQQEKKEKEIAVRSTSAAVPFGRDVGAGYAPELDPPLKKWKRRLFHTEKDVVPSFPFRLEELMN